MFILFVPIIVTLVVIGANVGMYYSEHVIKYLKSRKENGE